MTDLESPLEPSTQEKFKKCSLNPNILSMGLFVKFPETIEAGKEYDVVLRQKKCSLDSRASSANANVIEDPDFAKYNPGWPTDAPPFDARFPHQNQLANCERNYIDYHRCRKLKGEDYENCNYFKKVYSARCPQHLINRWDDEIENGTFRHRLV